MFLIVGLGNIGTEYDNTRHNFGFMAADKIYNVYPFTKQQQKFSATIAGGEIVGYKTVLMKPSTYMNNSGQAVLKACGFYKIPPEYVIVLHDEADLPLGTVKVKIGGSDAGHNGIKSIDQAIGKNYIRVRLGIQPIKDELTTQTINYKTPDFVLGHFNKTELPKVEQVITKVTQELPALFVNDLTRFSSRVNQA